MDLATTMIRILEAPPPPHTSQKEFLIFGKPTCSAITQVSWGEPFLLLLRLFNFLSLEEFLGFRNYVLVLSREYGIYSTGIE